MGWGLGFRMGGGAFLFSVQQAPAGAAWAPSARGAGTGLAASGRSCGEEVCTQHLTFVLKKELSICYFLEGHYGKISKLFFFI